MRKKWTEECYYRLSKMYYKNKTDKEIAKEFNTTEINIYQLRVFLGLTDNYRVDWEDEDVRRYIINHMKKAPSMNKLSDILKVGNSTIRRVLRKYCKEGYINRKELNKFLNK